MGTYIYDCSHVHARRDMATNDVQLYLSLDCEVIYGDAFFYCCPRGLFSRA